MLVEQVLHTMNAQTFTPGAWKQDLLVTSLPLCQPVSEDGEGGFSKRCASFLATLADHSQVRPGANHEVLSFEPGHLRQTQTRLHRDEDEGEVAPTRPGAAIRSGEQGVNLRA